MLLIGLFLDLTLDNFEGRELAVNLLELVILRGANSSGLLSKRTVQNNEVFIKIQTDRGSHLSHNRISFLCLWLVQDALRAARLARAFLMISLTSALICSISGNSVKNHILTSP